MKNMSVPAPSLEPLSAHPSARVPSHVVGSYDEAPGPVQMAAVHMALITYFGTYDWVQERDRRFPAAHAYRFPPRAKAA